MLLTNAHSLPSTIQRSSCRLSLFVIKIFCLC
uniref:Uncharacterized protein n=1 Tax=Rhizophora mucronata TaxID=61149 RepID=A0A2P2R263_RHIMU